MLDKDRTALIKLGDMLLAAEDLGDEDKALVEKIQSALENCSDEDLDFLASLSDPVPCEPTGVDLEMETQRHLENSVR